MTRKFSIGHSMDMMHSMHDTNNEEGTTLTFETFAYREAPPRVPIMYADNTKQQYFEHCDGVLERREQWFAKTFTNVIDDGLIENMQMSCSAEDFIGSDMNVIDTVAIRYRDGVIENVMHTNSLTGSNTYFPNYEPEEDHET